MNIFTLVFDTLGCAIKIRENRNKGEESHLFLTEKAANTDECRLKC